MTKRLTDPEQAEEQLGTFEQKEIEAYETIATVLAGLGDADAVIRISRRGDKGGLEFCEQIPAEATFGPQYIKDNWGGGHYSVQFYGPGGKYIKAVTQHIAGKSKEKAEPVVEGVGRGSADTQVLIELARLQGKVEGLTAGAGTSSPLDSLEKLTTIVKNLMPAQAPANAGAKEMIEFAREVVGFGRELAPETTPEATPWGMLIEKGIEPAITIIKDALDAQKRGQAFPPPPGIPEAQAVAEIAAPNPGGPMWQLELAKIVPRLLKRAREGKDPTLAADLFLEDAPGIVVQQLDGLVDDPNFVATVLGLAEQSFPDVSAVRGWVEEFLRAVQEGIIDNRPDTPTLEQRLGEESAPPKLTVEVSDKKKKVLTRDLSAD